MLHNLNSSYSVINYIMLLNNNIAVRYQKQLSCGCTFSLKDCPFQYKEHARYSNSDIHFIIKLIFDRK